MTPSSRNARLAPQLPKQLPDQHIETLVDHAEYAILTAAASDLTGQTATHVLFEQVRLRHIVLNQTRLAKLRVLDARLETCDLSGSDWQNAAFRRVECVGCRLWGAQLIEARFEDVLFKDCKAERAIFASSKFKAARFEKCDLREASFHEADLAGVVFKACDLSDADLRGANLKGADFRGSLLNRMQVGALELRGAIIDAAQALQVAALLGLMVKDETEDVESSH